MCKENKHMGFFFSLILLTFVHVYLNLNYILIMGKTEKFEVFIFLYI